jgi:carbamoyltransferase
VSDGPVILAIQFGGHDTAAALMIGGRLVAACEQERYDRVKHSRAFPSDAIADCLAIGGVTIDDVDEIAWCSDPLYCIRETYLRSALEDDDRIGFLLADADRIRAMYTTGDLVREKTGFGGHVHYHLHHDCHLASAWYPSGFTEALLASWDGMGEIETNKLAIGRDGAIEELHAGARYPDSLGLLYSAVTFWLGWRHHCDEGIVMGLAPYGDEDATVPAGGRTYREVFEEIVVETGPFAYEIDRSWIEYHRVRDTWISQRFLGTFGGRRAPGGELGDVHRNVAAALQARVERVVLAQLERARDETGLRRLALAGGVALNCSMNGAIEASRLFDEIFVQPASGDAGTTIGACYLSHARLGGAPRPARRDDFYLGSGFTDDEATAAFAAAGLKPERPDDVGGWVAERLEAGRIVGWFQGRAELGPRALGNRSLLARPTPGSMKDHINDRVKHREAFRPFAPAVLADRASEYFAIRQPSPHMLIATEALAERRDDIAAVVHVDGSSRVQTVDETTNPRFFDLLTAYAARTGCPVLLNTSFNVKGEPIVNTPAQAIACYLGTNIDVLVVGDLCVEK